MAARKGKLPLVVGLAAFALALLLGALFDLQITQALNSPTNAFAIWMESFGWYPAFFAPAVLLAVVATEGGRAQRAVSGVLLAALVLGTHFVAAGYLANRGWIGGRFSPGSLLWLLPWTLLVLTLALWLRWATPALRARLLFYGAWGTVLTLAELLLANILKLVWARPRFDEMLAAGADGLGQFTNWYQPFGSGGSSFPSGHTANAACVLALVVLCDVAPRLANRRVPVYLCCWLYIGLMGFSRLLAGRHFLSDVAAGAVLTAFLLFALRRLKTYNRGANKLKTGWRRPAGE